MSRRGCSQWFATLLVVGAWPSIASAGGYSLPVHGVRSLSMGGASVATVRGADALLYNPANLDETEISIDAAMISLNATYQRLGGDGEGMTASNQAPLLPNPQVAGIWRVSDRATLALGAYAPYAGQLRFDENGPQRYMLVQNHESVVLFVHAAGALRLGNLRIGAGLQNVFGFIKQRQVLSAYTGMFGWAEDPELDVLTQIELDDPVTLTGNFGASYEAGPVTLGASVQLPFTIGGDAKIKRRLPSSVFFDGVGSEGDLARLELPFPLMARAGIGLQVKPWLNIEVAGTFEDWSVQQRVVIEPLGNKMTNVPGIGDYRIGAMVIDKRMRDTFSAHVGGDAEIMRGLHLRAGAFFETSAFGDETFSLAQSPDDSKIGLAFGASWKVGAFRFDAVLGHIFQGTRAINDSALRQMNSASPDQAAVIANGVYNTNYWLGGFSVAFTPGDTHADRLPSDPNSGVSF